MIRREDIQKKWIVSSTARRVYRISASIPLILLAAIIAVSLLQESTLR